MGLLELYIAPPREDHMMIAKYIIILLSLFFIPYISILLGSTLFSLGFSVYGKLEEKPLHSRFGKDLADTFLKRMSWGAILAVLPVATLSISFSQLLYGKKIPIVEYFGIILLFVILGWVCSKLFQLSFRYRESGFLLHILMGIFALGFIFASIYAFVSVVKLVIFPERWPFVSRLLLFPYEWNMLARFLQFIMTAIALTGIAILLFMLNKDQKDQDGAYRAYVKKFASGVALAFTLIQALFMLWNVATLPSFAKSGSLYATEGIAVILLLFIGLYLYALLSNTASTTPLTVFLAIVMGVMTFGFFAFRFINGGMLLLLLGLTTGYILYSIYNNAPGKTVLQIGILSMFFCLVVLARESVARENALQYQFYHLEALSQELKENVEAQKEARRMKAGGKATVSLETGERVYNKLCTACHQFDKRVVGPPYIKVLPKYNGDVAKLKAFILNPVKIDPDYPPMPNQGLKSEEAESAALYLLEEVKKYATQ